MRTRLQKTITVYLSLCFIMGLGHSAPQAQLPRPITVTGAWAPPTLGRQRIGVAYFTVRNAGAGADRLLGVDLAQGGQARMHMSQIQDGVMRMRPVDAAVIPAGGELVLQPGGMHVMLNELPGPLIEGGRLNLILRFEKAGQLDVEAEIKKHPSASHQHQDH